MDVRKRRASPGPMAGRGRHKKGEMWAARCAGRPAISAWRPAFAPLNARHYNVTANTLRVGMLIELGGKILEIRKSQMVVKPRATAFMAVSGGPMLPLSPPPGV